MISDQMVFLDTMLPQFNSNGNMVVLAAKEVAQSDK